MTPFRNRLPAFGLVSLLLAASFVPLTVGAQTPDEAPSAASEQLGEEVPADEDRASDFRTVRGSETEDVPGGALLIGAYIGILVIFMLFLLRLAGLIKATQRELDGLREDVLPPDGN